MLFCFCHVFFTFLTFLKFLFERFFLHLWCVCLGSGDDCYGVQPGRRGCPGDRRVTLVSGHIMPGSQLLRTTDILSGIEPRD